MTNKASYHPSPMTNSFINNHPVFDPCLPILKDLVREPHILAFLLPTLLADIHFGEEFNLCFAYPDVTWQRMIPVQWRACSASPILMAGNWLHSTIWYCGVELLLTWLIVINHTCVYLLEFCQSLEKLLNSRWGLLMSYPSKVSGVSAIYVQASVMLLHSINCYN